MTGNVLPCFSSLKTSPSSSRSSSASNPCGSLFSGTDGCGLIGTELFEFC